MKGVSKIRDSLIRDMIPAYHKNITKEDHQRYRSWEHCYKYFQENKGTANHLKDRHYAALQLAFYLASWGMYRGSGFILQYSYTVHLDLINLILDPRFAKLWEIEFGSGKDDSIFIQIILELINAIREEYQPYADAVGSKQVTDTLVTKIILGTFGCLPACDQYFIDGFRADGFSYSYLNEKFIERVLAICHDNLHILREEQERIEESGGVRYPVMKLVDMYFWQVGFEHRAT